MHVLATTLAICLVILLVQAALAMALWLNLRRDETVRLTGKRIRALPWRARLRLGMRLMRDSRVPRRVRLIPPALAVYLASPVDVIPDFLPVIGQLDDLLVLTIGVGLMVKLLPAHVLGEHLEQLEAVIARQ